MATMIAWNDEYSVDIREIDDQHQVIVELINRLYGALATRARHTVVEEILDELVRYTRIHFAVEECLLRVFGYPGYEEHKAIHDRIVERVQIYQNQYRGGCRQIGMELLYFLKDWLVDHIREEDRAYSPHLTRNSGLSRWLRVLR